MSDQALERGLPASVDTERIIFGCILLDDRHYAEAATTLTARHFALDTHQRIFAAMERLHGKQQPIDIITLIEELRHKREVESVGGVAYLASLTEGMPQKLNIGQYVRIVKQKAMLRDVILAADRAMNDATDNPDEPEAVIQALQSELREIVSDNETTTTVESVSEFFIRKYGSVDKYLTVAPDTVAISTPWARYNAITKGGIRRKELTIVAARPSMGKTAWAINLASHVAVRLQKKVMLFSSEQPKEQILDRAVCALAHVTLDELRSKQQKFTQTQYVTDALTDLMRAFLYIDDTGNLNVDQIDARAELRSTSGGLDLMITDFLQNLDPGARFAKSKDTRAVQIGIQTKVLRNTGRRLNVANVVLAQTGRADKNAKVVLPRLSDLRESGDIEQNADQVTFIHRPEYYETEVSEETKGDAEFVVAKQRNGSIGTVRTKFHGEYFSFADE
jgi:replicative DNA helicase